MHQPDNYNSPKPAAKPAPKLAAEPSAKAPAKPAATPTVKALPKLASAPAKPVASVAADQAPGAQKGSFISRALPRTISTRFFPSTVEISSGKKFQLVEVNQERLAKTIINEHKSVALLVEHIESQMAQGFLPEPYFIELLANPFYRKENNKELKEYRKRIKAIFKKMVEIYADTIISLNLNQVKSLILQELMIPQQSYTLTYLCFAELGRLLNYIKLSILGFESGDAFYHRDQTIDLKTVIYKSTLRLQMWIYIAKKLYDQGNVMGFLAVMQAIDGREIGRLKKVKAGLSPEVLIILEELIKHEEHLNTNAVTRSYYLNVAKKPPLVPSVHKLLVNILEITEKAGDISFLAEKEGVWQKAVKLGLKDEEIYRLLLEQHPIYAGVIPVLEFVQNKAYTETVNFCIDNLHSIAMFCDQSPENREAISEAMQPRIIPKEDQEALASSQSSTSAQPAEVFESLIIPNNMLIYVSDEERNKKKEEKRKQKEEKNKQKDEQNKQKEDKNIQKTTELAQFKKWFLQKYNYHFDVVLKNLRNLQELCLTGEHTALGQHKKIDYHALLSNHEELCIHVSQNLYIVTYFERLGTLFGFKELGIDEKLVNEAIKLKNQLSLSEKERIKLISKEQIATAPDQATDKSSEVKSDSPLDVVRAIYIEVRQLQGIHANQTNEIDSVTDDFIHMQNRCSDIWRDIEDFLKLKSEFSVIEIKRMLKELEDNSTKLSAIIEKARLIGINFKDNLLGIKLREFLDIKDNLPALCSKLGRTELSLCTDLELIRRLNAGNIKLNQLNLSCTSMITIPSLKQKRAFCVTLLEQAEEILFDLPLSEEKKDYSGKEKIHEDLIILKNAIKQKIKFIRNEIIAINIQKQFLADTRRRQEVKSVDVLKADAVKRPVIDRLRLLPRQKVGNDLLQYLTANLRLPIELKLGKYALSGSFFDSMARILNAFGSNELLDEVILRQKCHAYYLTHRDEVRSWPNFIASLPSPATNAKGGGSKEEQAESAYKQHDPYYKIQYPHAQMTQFFKKTAINGNCFFEGRMLCAILQLPEIFIAQINADNNVQYCRITADSFQEVPSIDYQHCIEKKVPLLVYKDGSYIPILHNNKSLNIARAESALVVPGGAHDEQGVSPTVPKV